MYHIPIPFMFEFFWGHQDPFFVSYYVSHNRYHHTNVRNVPRISTVTAFFLRNIYLSLIDGKAAGSDLQIWKEQ